MITPFNLFTSIAWIGAGIISTSISLLFFIKNPNKRLNQLFSAGFICWSFSLFFNGIVFIIAYTSLALANIFRDISVITGIMSAIILVIAAIGIYFGAETLHWVFFVIACVIIIGLSVLGVLNDWVVQDILGGYKTTNNLLGKTFVQLIPALFVICGAILLIKTYFKLKHKSAKKRIGYFVIGFLTIIIGLLMFVIDFIVDAFPYLFPSLAIITWVMGPLLILIGFYIKVEADPRELVKPSISSIESKTLDSKQKIERPS